MNHANKEKQENNILIYRINEGNDEQGGWLWNDGQKEREIERGRQIDREREKEEALQPEGGGFIQYLS